MKIITPFLLILISLFHLYGQNWGANTFSQSINEALDVEINNQNQSYVAGYLSGQTGFNTSINAPSSNGNGSHQKPVEQKLNKNSDL